ncbi:MAG TPA: hypothetical protein VFB50_12420 [Chloroflexota bacterium]|nr:hypothetical protein [Chloroflexota bacterium]
MVWVRLEDDIDEHPKLAAIDDHAFAVYVCGLAYCNRQLTDGFIPTGIGLTLRHCGGKAKQAIMALTRARLWEPVAGGWRVHDFLDYQPSREKVAAERAQKQAAGQAGGKASAQAKAERVLKQNSTPVPGTRLTPALNTVGLSVGQSGGGVGEPQPLGRFLASYQRQQPAEVTERLQREPIADRPTDQPTVNTNSSEKTTTC